MVNAPRRPHRLRSTLLCIRELAAADAVRITMKARNEMAILRPPATFGDVIDVLQDLAVQDWSTTLRSAVTGEPMHVFKPMTRFGLLYLKVVIRLDCVVVSFHEEVEP